MVDHKLCGKCANGGTQTIGHNHKQSLCRGTYAGISILVHEKGTADVEEIECDTVDDTAEDKHPDAGARVAQPEESEAEHPCQHGNHHDAFDAEAFEEEWDEEDAACFADLAQGNEDVGMFGTKGDELVLGPFQGPVACSRIPFGRGVCGTYPYFRYCFLQERGRNEDTL